MAHRITRSLAAPVRVDGPDGPQEVRCSASTGLVLVDLPGAVGRWGSGGRRGRPARRPHGPRRRQGRRRVELPRLHRRPARTRRPPAHGRERPAPRPGGGRAARALPTRRRPARRPPDGVRGPRPVGAPATRAAAARAVPRRRGGLRPRRRGRRPRPGGGPRLPRPPPRRPRRRQHLRTLASTGRSRRRWPGPDRRGLAPDRLTVELLEGSLVPGDPVTEAELRDLAALGVGVLIDDFGTGYSTLSYLRRCP